MNVKPGHEEVVQQIGVRPPAKIPFGLYDQYNTHLDKLYETLEPIDGHELMVASQVVPVCEI